MRSAPPLRVENIPERRVGFDSLQNRKENNMGLSYYFEFRAPAEETAEKLERFLQGVEQYADSAGFTPNVVLNVVFDTTGRREFSRRLGGSFTVQDDRLKGAVILNLEQVRDHDAVNGECRLIPERGVVLVVTDERGAEACFGFFKLPEQILDIYGNILAQTNFGGAWAFRDFVDTPDPRYREIVCLFVDAGYAVHEKDEYV
jgi:hypothetical protein